MSFKNYEVILEFLEKEIRPKVQGDGGDFEVISLEENKLEFYLTGDCSRCPITDLCYKQWLRDEIKEKFLRDLEVNTITKKPYFWD